MKLLSDYVVTSADLLVPRDDLGCMPNGHSTLAAYPFLAKKRVPFFNA